MKHYLHSLKINHAMKMGPIQPQENKYFWNDADAIVEFAIKNNLKVRGQTSAGMNKLLNGYLKIHWENQ